MGGKCENCVYYSYDEEYDDYMVRFLTARADSCPYWRPGDEYITARKQ